MDKLRTKIAISFAILAIVLSGVIIFSMYTYVRVKARESTRQRLMDIASTAALLIDVDLHSTLMDAEQMTSNDFLTIRKQLDNLLLDNQNILYAYTMRYVDGEVVFVVDSVVGEGEPADLNEVYEEAEGVLADYIASASEPWADEDFTTDEWGTVLSGYAPLITSEGDLDGIIGVDMAVDDVRAYENQFLRISLIAFLVSSPLVIIAGWLLGNRLAAPLNRLSTDVRQIAAGDLSHRAEIDSKDEISQLAQSFNHMTDQVQYLIQELEDRVAQRTQELETRTHYLEATAQVSMVTSAILDVDQLIQEVVEQIRTNFSLYYVGLFLTDANQEWAILRAGTDEQGEKMLARGHRIQVGNGMIGWSIANGLPRVAQFADLDTVRLVNAELPDTRSEAALPLRSRGRILGAISVQSDQVDTFDEQTVKVLQLLADQIAITIENAQLLIDNQATVQELKEALDFSRRAYGEISQEAWRQLVQSRDLLGYVCKQSDAPLSTQSSSRPVSMKMNGGEWPEIELSEDDILEPSPDAWNPHMITAMTEGRIVRLDDQTIALPIKIRGQVTGAIRLSKTQNDGGWTEDEIELITTLGDQLSVALESARLYENARKRAERERLAGEITAKVRSSNNPEVILQTAVSELRRALQASRAQVLVKSAHRSTEDDQSIESGYAPGTGIDQSD